MFLVSVSFILIIWKNCIKCYSTAYDIVYRQSIAPILLRVVLLPCIMNLTSFSRYVTENWGNSKHQAARSLGERARLGWCQPLCNWVVACLLHSALHLVCIRPVDRGRVLVISLSGNWNKNNVFLQIVVGVWIFLLAPTWSICPPIFITGLVRRVYRGW